MHEARSDGTDFGCGLGQWFETAQSGDVTTAAAKVAVERTDSGRDDLGGGLHR